MTSKIRRRLQQLEQKAVEASEYRSRMNRQLQTKLGLPLPENAPADIRDEGLRRFVALRDALRQDSENLEPVRAFQSWVQSMHDQYGSKEQ